MNKLTFRGKAEQLAPAGLLMVMGMLEINIKNVPHFISIAMYNSNHTRQTNDSFQQILKKNHQ